MGKTIRNNYHDKKREKRNTSKRLKHNKHISKHKAHDKHHNKNKLLMVKSETPLMVQEIGKKIAQRIKTHKSSYSPTINKELVTLLSLEKEPLNNCNTNYESPLIIQIRNKDGSSKCVPYYDESAKKLLLKNLAANKHIDPYKVITPKQYESNCWFNTMFVMFFVSDKGRKFFHFFRQLMIEGKQSNGQPIPNELKDAFALLNYAVESCLLGSPSAYEFDTNIIIHDIYKKIPESYKKQYEFIVDVDTPGNPLAYYAGIINYLNNHDIKMFFIEDADETWKSKLGEMIKEAGIMPHIVVIEVREDYANSFRKPMAFKIDKAKYQLDSAAVRDTSAQHFCATLTANGRDCSYDGMSYSRLNGLAHWKKRLNSNISWSFEGEDYDEHGELYWNFTRSYQMLMYYRTE